MKRAVVLMALMPLAACVQPQEEKAPIGMANPASVYCESIGGRAVNQKAADGSEAGYCHLKDGKVVNDWDLFRSQS